MTQRIAVHSHDLLGRREPVWTGLWALLSANAAALVWQIGHQSLWLDEMTSLAVASGPIERAVAYFSQHREQHPLYYLLLRGWLLVLGSSEAALRSFSALAAVSTTLLVYLVGRRLMGERPARIATALAAFSPFLLYYGQEGRMYALLMAQSLWLTYLFQAWWRDPTHQRAMAYWAVGVLTVYTHIAGLLVVAAHAAWALVACGARRRIGPVVVLSGAIVAAYLPWLVFLLGHPAPEQEWKSWVHVAFGLPYTLLRWSLGYSIVLANAGWKERVPDLVRENLPILAAAAVGYGSLLLAGLAGLRQQLRDPPGLVLALLAVPVLLAALASPVAILLSERYLSVSFPAFLLVVAAGMDWWSRNGRGWRWSFAPLLLAASVGVALWRYYTDPAYGKAEWRAVAQLVARDVEPSDLVLLHDPAIEPVFRYYARRLPQALTTSVPGAVDSARRARRVWLVVSHAADGGEPLIQALSRTRAVELDTLFSKEVGIRVVRLAGTRTPGNGAFPLPTAASFGASSDRHRVSPSTDAKSR